METGSLIYHYQYLAATQGLPGLMGKLSLGAALLAVVGGQRAVGMKVLHFTLAGHFLVAAWLGLSGGGLETALLAVVALVLAGAALQAGLRDRTDWDILPEAPAWQAVAIGALLLAFAWPFWRVAGGIPGRMVWSLMGPAPHQTLLVFLVLIGVQGPRAPRAVSHAVIACGVGLALLDSFLTEQRSTLLIGLAALGAGSSMYREALTGSGEAAAEEQAPIPASRFRSGRGPEPAPERPSARPEAKAPAETGPRRKWNLR